MRNRLLALLAVLIPTMFLAGCSGGNINAGSGGGGTTPAPTAPALTLSATSLTFTATVGQTSAAQIVTLTNTGNAALTLSSILLADKTDYALMSTCGGSLAASASCMLSISFAPQSAASLPSSVTITDNASGSPQTITLAGSGSAALIPQAMLSQGTVTFPGQTSGVPVASLANVTLTNAGTATLSITSIILTGANASAFSVINTCGSTLAPTGSCTFAISFGPAVAGSYSAYIAITDNSGNVAGAVQDLVLAGTGYNPPAAAQAVLSPASITFSTATVGTAAPGQTVTLSNPGASTLTGIAASITGGTSSSAFAQTNNCGTTLAAGGSCTFFVTFTPATTGTFSAALSVADSASGSPQAVALAGIGAAPQATLSAASITFPATTTGTKTPAYSVTVTNTGAATLTISSIVLTNPAGSQPFAETTTCGPMLAAAASCAISATFAPPTAAAYSGTITLTDNATNVQAGNAAGMQTIALSGAGTASAISRTLYAFPETDLSVTPLYSLVNNAQKTIDMTMYELVDTTFSGDLVAACNRGVKVRVILDQNLEKSSNTAAYNQLNAVTNCSAAWANPAFQATHQKSFIVDGAQVAIMSLNLTSRYYSTTRDYALVENDPADIAAVQATFNTDYGSTTDYSYQPGPGDDLIWSPTTAQADLLGIIIGAKTTLLVENEEMSASNIVSALEAACQRGVSVHIAMTDTGSYHANFKALEAAGCGVHTYADNATTLYIHAKAMVADYALPTQNVYMGSINFSIASMTENRELGLYIADPAGVQALYTTISSDYAGAPPF